VVSGLSRPPRQTAHTVEEVEVVIEVGDTRITARGALRPEHFAAMMTSARSC
jgi:hypothetical protein